jgi:hypothetical protein
MNEFHLEPAAVHQFGDPILRVDAYRATGMVEDCLFHVVGVRY